MRVQGNQGPAPLDRQSGVKKGEGASGGRSANRASSNAPSTRGSAAIHKAAQALARELSQAAEERPGAGERAAELLARPFDEAAARETAFKLLVGERSPGDGRSLYPGD